MLDNARTHADICGEGGLILRDKLRWFFAGLTVLLVYGAAAVGLCHMTREPERLAGAPPAIMLEFAAEPTSPDVEAVSETIQAEMQVDDAQPEPEAQSQPPRPQEVKPADFALTTEAEKKTQPEHKQQTTQQKHTLSPDRKKHERQHKKPRKNIAKGPQDQRSAAPDIAAKSGKTFAAPRNSRSEGFNGKSDKAWADRVYRKIQSVGRRMQRQLPGGRGIVYISFVYDATGSISSANVSRSSGNSRVDQLALRIVENSSPLPKPPDAGQKTVPVRIN